MLTMAPLTPAGDAAATGDDDSATAAADEPLLDHQDEPLSVTG